MSETMTIKEVADAILAHFGGNRGIATQGLISFLQEQDDEEGGTYETAVVEEWLNR